jgi:outer membrane immunogenic protein
MRNNLWCGIGLLASITAGAGSAMAADMAVKAPPAPAMPVYLSDWAGFYIGINGGGGWADTKFDMAPAFNMKPSGGLVGGHAGYNWQYGSVVAGVEADFDGADIQQTVAPFGRAGWQDKTDELATARARLGYVFFPNVLAYGTAGAAWGHSEVLNNNTAFTSATTQFGWTVGAGLEYKLIDHVLLRAEYLHYDFANTTFSGFGPVKESIDAVRGGLSYKF